MIKRDMPALRLQLSRPLGVLLLLVSVATVAGLFAEKGWFFELFSHFPLQYSCIAAVCVVMLVWCGQRRLAMLGSAVVVVNLAVLSVSQPLGEPAVASVSEGERLSLLLTNVERVNLLHDPIIRYIEDEGPDIVAVLEIDTDWRRVLDARLDAYPHRLLRTREDNFGIGVYSRVPLIEPEVLDLSGTGRPSLSFRVMIGEESVRVLVTHPEPPLGRVRAGLRDRQLTALAGLAKDEEGPMILMGDLNLTPWSPRFRALLDDGGLGDSRVGFGHHATWPVWFPLLAIPIDHLLVNQGLKVYRREVGPAVGSDHYPVLVEVGIRRS